MLRALSGILLFACTLSAPSDAMAQSTGDWVAIYYAPHQDDEAIGMAAGIREHIDAGRPVWLVLMIKGDNSGMVPILNGTEKCTVPWLHGKADPYYHTGADVVNLTPEQVGWARITEFTSSARKLGVKEVFVVNDSAGVPEASCTNSTPNDMADVIRRFERLAYAKTGVRPSHKLASGLYDDYYDASRNPPQWILNDSHRAEWEAAHSIYANCANTANPSCATSTSTNCCINDFLFYRVYRYWGANSGCSGGGNQQCTGVSSCITAPAPALLLPTSALSPPGNAQGKTRLDWKREALDEYKRWDPAAGRYAVGYHSVWDLIDTAGATPTSGAPSVDQTRRQYEYIDGL